MPNIQIETEQLLNAALQMPRAELEQFVARLFALKAREFAPVLPQRESELLLQINQGLPLLTRERLNELIERRRSHTLTEDELRELCQLTDRIEKFDAERLQSLVELAALRTVSLDDLICQLELKPHPHD
ncbi:MAG: STAS/SEC14 domain-containing protein [Acidobacteria bacterium]|nr:STAS/SEC14 domain-containing protein [Acidobacteriota bacterium]